MEKVVHKENSRGRFTFGPLSPSALRHELGLERGTILQVTEF